MTDSPAPIATPEEVARKCMLIGVSLLSGTPIHLSAIEGQIADAIAAERSALSTLKEENERLTRWRPTHEHYRGGLYRVIARGRIEADLSPCVIYDNAAGETWVRPAGDFDQTDPFVRFAALSTEPTKET